jgi:MFS superfamily sulfate permease-like transporter
LQTGILVSVAISLVSIVRQSARSAGIQIMGRVPGTEEWLPVEDEANDDDLLSSNEEIPGALIVRLKESLHFANAGALKERLRRLERYGTKKHHPSDAPFREEAQIVVFYVKDLHEVDASALHILRETCESYHDRGVQVYFAHVAGDMMEKFEKAELVDLVGRGELMRA